MQDTISAKGQRWDFGDQIAEWKNDEYGCGAQGYDYFLSRFARTIVSYLIAFERLFWTKQTKKEPACSVAEQAGVPIDRVFVGIDRAKGVILPLDHRVRQMDRKRTKPLR